MSCKSGIEPLKLGFSNVTLLSNGQALSNGVAVQVGTPGQILALTPSTLSNNTLLTNSAFCASNNSACISTIGGGFNPSDSSTYESTTIDAWNGSLENVAYYDALLNVHGTYFNDDLTIGVNQKAQTIPGFPFLLANLKSSFYPQLGIGSNSTFINSVVDAGLAPSRSYSFFAGIYSSLRAGVLIIGGSAERFYQGTLYTKNNTNPIGGISFRVENMVYEEHGRTTSLMPDNANYFDAFVDPFYPTLVVANSTAERFGSVTNGTYDSELGLYTYPTATAPKGNITITLDNNLTTTIPYYALFDPPAYDNGILSIYRNGTTSTTYGVVATWSVYGAAPPTGNGALFGMPYAAMVYIMQDYERNTVSIANANQDAEIGGSVTPICSLKDSTSSGSNHTGAIAGGVVGGVVGLALIALLAWFLWRRKKTAANVGSAPLEKDTSDEAPSELKSELATSGTVVHNRASVEKPADPVGQATEMSNETSRVEMSGSQQRPPAELPSDANVVRSELPA